MGCESKEQIQVQDLNLTKLSLYLYLQGSDVGSALLLVRWLGMPTTLGRGGGGGRGGEAVGVLPIWRQLPAASRLQADPIHNSPWSATFKTTTPCYSKFKNIY